MHILSIIYSLHNLPYIAAVDSEWLSIDTSHNLWWPAMAIDGHRVHDLFVVGQGLSIDSKQCCWSGNKYVLPHTQRALLLLLLLLLTGY